MHILDLSIKEIHQALINKEITVLDLVKEALRRAKEDKNNAFELILEEQALEQAAKLTEIDEDNELYGIPYVLKDNFSTKDILTTGSSNILNNYIPVFNATVVEKLAEKHAVLIAKGTLDELAMGGTGTSGHKGITYNPFDDSKTRLCGGSSCGSAAAVSAGIVPFSIGSDTGDSVRKPASFNGLVGIKPTWGRISRYGVFPFATSMDHVGYFTRTVEDSAILLKALAGRDEKDSTSSNIKVDDYSENLCKTSIKSKRIAVIKEIINSIQDQYLLNKFNVLIDNIKLNGGIVDFVSMNEKLLNAVLPTYFVISCAEAGSNNANLDGIKFGVRQDGATYDEIMKNTRTAGFSTLIRRRFIIGSYVLFSENIQELFLRAQKARRLIVNEYNSLLENYDVILTPAAPSIAPKLNSSSDKLSANYLIADNHLAIQNFAGLPSITIPFCLEDGMPIGINITSKKFEEKLLFEFSKNIEDLTGLSNLSINNRKDGNL